MIDKHCIIIDDDDQTVQIERLTQGCRHDGINLSCHQINPNQFVIDDQDSPEIKYNYEDLMRSIKVEIRKGAVLIACDNNLGDNLQGYRLLYDIRSTLNFRHDVILYSGALDSLIKSLMVLDNNFAHVKMLVEAKISKFLKRGDTYIDDIKGTLTKQSFDCQNEILNWLFSFETSKLNLGHPDFKNRTYLEIAEEIQKETPLGIQFQKILIEQAFSIFTELNPPSADV